MNFNNCCDGNIFIAQGADPIVLNTEYRFVGNLKSNAPSEEIINFENFNIYHLHFKPAIDQEYVNKKQKDFNITWHKAPKEIIEQYVHA
jgi:hypothetical protein